METVPRLYKKVRGRAAYQRSLDLLAHVKRRSPATVTKSGLMLGLGETIEELFDVLADLRAVAVRHADARPVPGADAEAHSGGPLRAAGRSSTTWPNLARTLGFKKVVAGPFVRSSYHADEMVRMTSRPDG